MVRKAGFLRVQPWTDIYFHSLFWRELIVRALLLVVVGTICFLFLELSVQVEEMFLSIPSGCDRCQLRARLMGSLGEMRYRWFVGPVVRWDSAPFLTVWYRYTKWCVRFWVCNCQSSRETVFWPALIDLVVFQMSKFFFVHSKKEGSFYNLMSSFLYQLV